MSLKTVVSMPMYTQLAQNFVLELLGVLYFKLFYEH